MDAWGGSKAGNRAEDIAGKDKVGYVWVNGGSGNADEDCGKVVEDRQPEDHISRAESVEDVPVGDSLRFGGSEVAG